MLLFCSHLRATQYYLGHLENERFYPEFHARMSWPGGHLGGARTLLDNQNRRIFFDWIGEMGGVERARAAGWCGVTTLPRVLSLNEDNRLRIEPVPELSVLRMNERSHQNLHVQPDSELVVEDMAGDCLELAIDISSADAREFGVKVRCSPDGVEQTTIFYDRASKTLKVGVKQSTLDDSIRYIYYRTPEATERLPEAERFVAAQAAPFELAAGESLQLRIFLDHSVLEVFANHRECITQRIYPTRPDSMGVRLFSKGGSAHVRFIRAWDMAPTHL
jgi:sucrose-6-phosphate hydrolase SacC (GH32 family)